MWHWESHLGQPGQSPSPWYMSHGRYAFDTLVLNEDDVGDVSKNKNRNSNIHINTATTVLCLDKLTEVEETDRLSVHLDVTDAAIKRHAHQFTRRLIHTSTLYTRQLSQRSTVRGSRTMLWPGFQIFRWSCVTFTFYLLHLSYCNTFTVVCAWQFWLKLVAQFLKKLFFVTYFCLMWHWPLTWWPPKLTIWCPCSVATCANFHQNSVHLFSRYCLFTSLVADRQTIWVYEGSASQSGLPETYEVSRTISPPTEYFKL